MRTWLPAALAETLEAAFPIKTGLSFINSYGLD